jgi:hypothetical protein
VSDEYIDNHSEEYEAHRQIRRLCLQIINISDNGRPVHEAIARYIASFIFPGVDSGYGPNDWYTEQLPDPDWLEFKSYGSDVAEIVRQILELHPKALSYHRRESHRLAEMFREQQAKVMERQEKERAAIPSEEGLGSVLLGLLAGAFFIWVLFFVLI